MRLSFVPPGMASVPVPGILSINGNQPKRVCQRIKGGEWISVDKPHEAEGREALLLVRMAQRGDLLPFDAATAKACGVDFQRLQWAGPTRGWEPAPKTTRASSSTSQRRETSTKD